MILRIVGLATVLGLAAGASSKPSISVRGTPQVSFSPATVLFVAELKGGPDDYQDFYCASVEWDWGDDTKMQSAGDCEPYESGKSQIKRRYSAQHRYQTAGDYKVMFRLKQKEKVVGAGSASVKVRPGLREPIGF